MKTKLKFLNGINLYSDDFEAKLEKLASNGLFLKKVNLVSTFRVEKPKKVKYATICLLNKEKNSVEKKQNLIELGKASGWTYIDTYNEVVVFYNEDQQALPFYSDEIEKFNYTKKIYFQNYIKPILFFLPIYIPLFITAIVSALSNLSYDSFDSSFFLLLFSHTIILLQAISTIADYLIWLHAAKKSLELDEKISYCRIHGQKILNRIKQVIAIIFVVVMMYYQKDFFGILCFVTVLIFVLSYISNAFYKK